MTGQWVQKILDITTPEIYLPKGLVDIPEEDVLADPTEVALLLQATLTRTESPPENKQPKRRCSSTVAVASSELSLVVAVASPPPGLNAQPVDLATSSEDDVSAVWVEYDMMKNAYSRFRILVATPGILGLSTGSFLSLADEQLTTSIVFVAATSHSSTPSASSSSSSSPSSATTTSFPPSSVLPPATATTSPPVTPDHKEGVPLP
uniref:Cell wall protein SED1-like n=2 Tax=Nicotiana TaxID=4085 RepID=A0A1S3YI99_TOBAC|nr:PREDICTED: cell wall protein SED1-like [Nicotiana sylvestris]XP_016451954.1 PREDICTED: cell wall protein SED1-like [Nicotiana tabacum]